MLLRFPHYGVWTFLICVLYYRVKYFHYTRLATSHPGDISQGTVLGPVLFLCHISDQPKVVSSQFRLFADDCLLYREINTFQDKNALQEDLKLLGNWADTRRMQLDAQKCYILSIKNNSIFLYSLN